MVQSSLRGVQSSGWFPQSLPLLSTQALRIGPPSGLRYWRACGFSLLDRPHWGGVRSDSSLKSWRQLAEVFFEVSPRIDYQSEIFDADFYRYRYPNHHHLGFRYPSTFPSVKEDGLRFLGRSPKDLMFVFSAPHCSAMMRASFQEVPSWCEHYSVIRIANDPTILGELHLPQHWSYLRFHKSGLRIDSCGTPIYRSSDEISLGVREFQLSVIEVVPEDPA